MEAPEYRRVIQIDGEEVTIRTIRPLDREIEAEFVKRLSPHSRFLRFQNVVSELKPHMLERFISPDYPNEMALIAVVEECGAQRQIGVARFSREGDPSEAEIAIVVSDDWQGRGVGTALLTVLRESARDAGIERLVARILRENRRMRTLASRLGFEVVAARCEEGMLELGKGI